ANSIYMNDSGVRVEDLNNEKVNNKYKNLRIKDLMEFYGFKNVKTYYLGEDSGASDGSDENRGYRDTHKSRVAIGYKNIEYHGIEKAVVGIVIRGTAEDDDWDSDFDMGDIDLLKAIQDDTEPGHENIDENISRINTYLNNNNTKYDSQYNNQLVHFVYGYPDWTHRYHHAGFDIVANRIIEIIGEYMNHETRGMNDEYSFWITGHSMGAGVANIVAAELLHGSSGINNRTDNVYCYTFAAPNTFYYTDNVKERDSRVFDGLTVRDYYREPKGNKYRCIFNIVNDDDFVPKLPMEECQWTKYGRTARVSIEKEIKPRLNNFIGPIQSGKYRNFIQNDYRSNKFAVDLVISLLQGVYDYQYSAPGDKNHMRNETYSYSSRLTLSGNTTYSQNEINKLNEDISYMDIQTLDDFVFEYSKPYQKNNENLFGYSQKQTPAFLMQSIAGAMHSKINVEGEKREQGEENTFLGFKVKDNQYRFIKTKMAYSGIGAKWSILLSGGPLNALETPHYLESYYTLTKELSIVDFR
ncbi:MAG: hypothetical protein IJ593_08055, partial [Lachnospiraceae bacterium]|nr:hypothetical protein [Lachnospiraceae bacterium]